MDVQVRAIRPDEFDAWHRSAARMFNTPVLGDDAIAEERTVMPVERMLAAVDGADLVGTTAAYDFELTVPGGTAVPAAGVTAVTVTTTHRRRGLLTELMRRQLDDVAERGEPLAVLNASETSIYGRFGYGPATSEVTLEIESRGADFVVPVATGGRLRLVDQHDASALVVPAYEAYRRVRPGALSRSPAWWDVVLGERPSWKGGGKQYVVVHEHAGAVDGFARYAIDEHAADGLQRSTVVLRELVAVEAEVEAALWRHCLDVDLSTSVRAVHHRVDSPLRWRLTDPRQLITRGRTDMLWLRILDPVVALEARRYAADGAVVVDVDDRFRPETSGRYRLEVQGGRASCSSTTDAADLSLGVDVLGAAYLGDVSFRTLAAARRVVEEREGAAARADALFATDGAPHCLTFF